MSTCVKPLCVVPNCVMPLRDVYLRYASLQVHRWMDERTDGRTDGQMDGSCDARLASPQNAAGAKINDIIAKHVLTSQF